MYNDFHMESCDSEFYTTEDLLCIDYCRQGRMEYPEQWRAAFGVATGFFPLPFLSCVGRKVISL